MDAEERGRRHRPLVYCVLLPSGEPQGVAAVQLQRTVSLYLHLHHPYVRSEVGADGEFDEHYFFNMTKRWLNNKCNGTGLKMFLFFLISKGLSKGMTSSSTLHCGLWRLIEQKQRSKAERKTLKLRFTIVIVTFTSNWLIEEEFEINLALMRAEEVGTSGSAAPEKVKQMAPSKCGINRTMLICTEYPL